MFKDFWQYIESVSDEETKSGWVDGFEFGHEANAAVTAVSKLEQAMAQKRIAELEDEEPPVVANWKPEEIQKLNDKLQENAYDDDE